MKCLRGQDNLRSGPATYTAKRQQYHLVLYDIPEWTCHQRGELVFEEKVVEAIQHLLMTLDEGMKHLGHWIRIQPWDEPGG